MRSQYMKKRPQGLLWGFHIKCDKVSYLVSNLLTHRKKAVKGTSSTEYVRSSAHLTCALREKGQQPHLAGSARHLKAQRDTSRKLHPVSGDRDSNPEEPDCEPGAHPVWSDTSSSPMSDSSGLHQRSWKGRILENCNPNSLTKILKCC